MKDKRCNFVVEEKYENTPEGDLIYWSYVEEFLHQIADICQDHRTRSGVKVERILDLCDEELGR